MATDQDWCDQVGYDLAAQLPGGPTPCAETQQIMDGVTARIPMLWSMYAGKANIPYLQYLYTLRHTTRMLMGQLRGKRDGSLGPLNVRDNQFFSNLAELYKDTQAEITDLEKKARGNMAPGVGQLIHRAGRYNGVPTTTLTPVANVGTVVASTRLAQLGPNPSDPMYGGDPRRRVSGDDMNRADRL